MSSLPTPDALCALVNSGGFRLPLSHTRALDLTARLYGAPNWNAAAVSPLAETIRARSILLRAEVNRRVAGGHLTLDAAREALVIVQTTAPCDVSVVAQLQMPDTPEWKRVRPKVAGSGFNWQKLFDGCPQTTPASYVPTTEHRDVFREATGEDVERLVATVEDSYALYCAVKNEHGRVECIVITADNDAQPIGAGPFAAYCGRGFLKFLDRPRPDEFEERKWFSWAEALEDYGGLIRNLRDMLPIGSMVTFTPFLPAGTENEKEVRMWSHELREHELTIRLDEEDGGEGQGMMGEYETMPDCKYAELLARGAHLSVKLPGADEPGLVLNFRPQKYAWHEPSIEEHNAGYERKAQEEFQTEKQVLFRLGDTGLFAFAHAHPFFRDFREPKNVALTGASPWRQNAKHMTFRVPSCELNGVVGPVFLAEAPHLEIGRVKVKATDILSHGNEVDRNGVEVTCDARDALPFDPALPLPANGLCRGHRASLTTAPAVAKYLRSLPNLFGVVHSLGYVAVVCRQKDQPEEIAGYKWEQYQLGYWSLELELPREAQQ